MIFYKIKTIEIMKKVVIVEHDITLKEDVRVLNLDGDFVDFLDSETVISFSSKRNAYLALETIKNKVGHHKAMTTGENKKIAFRTVYLSDGRINREDIKKKWD